MIYLSTSIPNAWMPKNQQFEILIQSISIGEIIELCCDYDNYADYADHVPPFQLKPNVKSVLGHIEMAEKMATEIWEFTRVLNSYGKPIKPQILPNRENIFPSKGDIVIAGLLVSNDRNNSPSSKNMGLPLRWLKVSFI